MRKKYQKCSTVATYILNSGWFFLKPISFSVLSYEKLEIKVKKVHLDFEENWSE